MDVGHHSAHAMRKRLVFDLEAVNALREELAVAELACQQADDAVLSAQAAQRVAQANARDLQDRLKALGTSAYSLRQSLRTMATFPAELLGLIIAAGVANRNPDLLEIDWDAALLPYRSATVSRHWRRAILHTAECWTYIVVPPVLRVTAHKAAALSTHCSTALTRSMLIPVDITVLVDWPSKSNGQDFTEMCAEDALYAPLFASFMDHSRRVRSLGMRTGGPFSPSLAWKQANNRNRFSHPGPILNKFIGVLRCPTPELVRLSISCAHTSQIATQDLWFMFPERDVPILLPEAPKLEVLDVSGAPVLCQRSHPVGLPALRAFTISNLRVYDALLWDTLALAPRLDSLVLRHRNEGPHPNYATLRPPSLPISHLEVDEDVYVSFSGIDLPKMRSLQSWNMRNPYSMARTLVKVTVESIYDLDIDLLRLYLVVEHVSLRGCDSEEQDIDLQDLFTALLDPAEPMWPCLRHLELWNFESEVESGGLLDVVRARNLPPKRPGVSAVMLRPLEKVEFDTKSVPGWVAAQLKEIMGDCCVVNMPDTRYLP